MSYNKILQQSTGKISDTTTNISLKALSFWVEMSFNVIAIIHVFYEMKLV